ncbi:MAG: hypothetical protein GY777_19890 [Candidatus Brocadiaceae bacterium]|nr:hypothetical protein [Candidatus Brocadiaceae bacterium]
METEIVNICRENALEYSRKVCKKINTNISDIFPIYFDYPDHLAVEESEFKEYPYHLNKAVRDIEILTDIFKDILDIDVFELWKANWFEQTRAAAWIHDIGMIDVKDEDRDEVRARIKHGETSARFLFKNSFGLDFSGISEENRIKIALICLKHNKDWPVFTDDKLSTIFAGCGISINEFKKHFDNFPNQPKWELEFSGKLISTVDCMRERGGGLRNNFRQQLLLMRKCNRCNIIYDCTDSSDTDTRKTCSTVNCDTQLVSAALVPCGIEHKYFYPGRNEGISVYRKAAKGIFVETSGQLTSEDLISVRNNGQIHLRGDLSLSNSEVVRREKWYEDLEKDKIDYEDIRDKVGNRYKTVLRLSIESEDILGAMFTFSKYIVNHLEKNLSIKESTSKIPFANRVILHITVSDKLTFNGVYSKFNSVIDDTEDKDKGIFDKTKVVIERTFADWADKGEMVLPVEIVDGRLKVVNL